MRRRSGLVVCALALVAASSEPGRESLPPIVVSRATTYVTTPLAADGLPDYGTWLDARGDAGIALADNAAPPLLEALGIAIDAATRRRLGLAEGPTNDSRLIPPPFGGNPSWAEDRARHGLTEPSSDEILQRFSSDAQRAEAGPWAPEEAPLAAEWLADNDEALDAVAGAVARRGYWWPRWQPGFAADPFPAAAAIAYGGRALAWRAALRVGTGRGPEAVDDLVASLRLAALASRGGTVLEGLLANAARSSAADVIAAVAGALHPRDAERLLEGMDALPEFPAFESLLETERVLQLGRFLELRRLGARGGARAWKPYVEWPDLNSAPAGIYEVDPSAVDWNELLRRVNRSLDGGENSAASPETDAVEEAFGIYNCSRAVEALRRTQHSLDCAREALRRTAGIDDSIARSPSCN